MLLLSVSLLMFFDTGFHALQQIFVPQLGVPCVEPAVEREWLLPLPNGADGDTAAARGVRVHVVLR